MLRKTLITLQVILSLFQIGRAQENSALITPLKVGDTVPDLLFDQVINYQDTVFKLSDFEGKALILDFWATWCVPCVASVPKLEQLQQENSDDLQIIMVTVDKAENIQRFYSNAPKLLLPTAMYSKEHPVAKLFPHSAIPHYIWIGKDRRVLAITENLDLADDKKTQLLTGRVADSPISESSNGREKHIGVAIDSIIVSGGRSYTISTDSLTLFDSKIRKYDGRLTPVSFLDYNGTNGRRVMYQVNHPISSLFVTAYLGRRSTSLKYESRFDAVFIDSADSTVTYPVTKNWDLIKQWEAENYYSYYLTYTGNGVDSAGMFRIMQQDLSSYFKIKAGFREESVRCLVLRRLTNFHRGVIGSHGANPELSSSIYHIELVSQPISTFFSILKRYGLNRTTDFHQRSMPIIDEAYIDYPINLYIKCDISNLSALNSELQKYGLMLQQAYRRQKTLVLSR